MAGEPELCVQLVAACLVVEPADKFGQHDRVDCRVHLVDLVRPARPEDHPGKKSLKASETERPDVVPARAHWGVVQVGIDPKRLVFLDETFLDTAMTRLYGWGPRDRRVIDLAPQSHWKTTTLVLALRLGGAFAPMVADGPVNGELFVAYLRQELAPRLRPGDIVVMDNLSTHKVKGVAQAIEAADAHLLYLPPYSPEFNPIENGFSKLKNEFRRRRLRTVEEVEQACGLATDWLTAGDVRGYFGHAGYTQGGK